MMEKDDEEDDDDDDEDDLLKLQRSFKLGPCDTIANT